VSSSVLEAPALNENLCRALLQARLTEEDLAAHLQVDPKTVRRWLEGRVPYIRHRWAIAAMLGVDETDLWPQLRTAKTRPDEVVAVYPHASTVPWDVWLRVLGSAQREIGILDHLGMPLVGDQPVRELLAQRARSGVSVRICLSTSGMGGVAERPASAGSDSSGEISDELAVYVPLREQGRVELRLHPGIVYSSIYFGDDQLLVSQHAHGIAAGQAPALYLRRAEDGDMADAYRDAFEQAWRDATSP
jgi:transcriptional regulator with XRE-family HTH domain